MYYPETIKHLILLVCAVFIIPVVVSFAAVIFLNTYWLQYLWIIRVVGTLIIITHWGRALELQRYRGFALLMFYLLVLLERIPVNFFK